jgi:UDP-3-O-[3-hydroxymyristoyl] glucosamine N-acyltransferase
VTPGVADGASVAASALVDASACIESGAVVGARASIGAGVRIGAVAVVGADAVIGPGTRLHPRAVVLDGCRLGERCIVASGAVIGADGFGFAPLDGRWIKIPQVGTVIIGNDVEIGANTTVDRGTMGDTIIEDGVKLDNQIQVAHNCFIGAHTVIAGCVGIAGSARIGRGCQIGGAAMIAGHLTIADGCAIGPATVVVSSVTEPGHYSAFLPLMKNRDWQRTAVILRNLDDLRDRLRQLESLQRQGKQP